MAYFRRSACRQGICGRCGVRLNGRPVLACEARIDPSLPEIRIEPRKGEIVRDLVVRE